MEQNIFDWLLQATQNFILDSGKVWNWLFTNLDGLNMPPIAIFGATGLLVVLGIIVVRFVV